MRIESGLLPGHVLQRAAGGANVTITGTTDATGPIVVTIASGRRALRGWSARRVGAARGGRFRVRLSGIPAGGPYRVDLTVGDDGIGIADVFVGDLWLMAGQSNMEGIGNLVDAPRPHPLVRCFGMARRWELARDPLHHLQESPDRVHNGGTAQTPAQAKRAKRVRTKGTGVGVHFGIEMHRRTGVPQGLIASAHGGTTMEQWDPARRDQGGESLYGSMLASLRAVGQPIAGVLWYQGESDTNTAAVAVYTARMQALIDAIRVDLRQPRLPVAIVQIGRVVAPGGEAEWNAIQDLQRLLPRSIRNLDVVAAVDLELDDVIHVSGAAYRHLGERLARVCDRLAHGVREPASPQPIAARVVPSATQATIDVRFTNIVGGLRAAGLPVGFALVDAQHRPVEVIYKTVLDGDRVVLELVHLDRTDLRLMYGWGKNPTCNVTDGRGLPLPVFGPIAIEGMIPVGPWLGTWQVGALRAGEDIGRLAMPTTAAFAPLTSRTFSGMVNLHGEWEGHSGHVAFFGDVLAVEDIASELRVGYDGPIRVWLDGKEVHRDLNGTNPAIPDSTRVRTSLRRGTHRLVVLMALNRGAAWGFFLRFGRLDLPASSPTGLGYAMPVQR